MSQTVTTKTITFKLPNIKANNNLTLAEKNENLLFLANLLADALDMVIFDDLTDEDATWGNAYYIGFENADHASIVLFANHMAISDGYYYYGLECVGDDNEPITNYSKYQRNYPDCVGFCMYNNYVNNNYYWALQTVVNSEGSYIAYLYATRYSTRAQTIQDIGYSASNNDYWSPNIYISREGFYSIFRAQQNLQFLNTPLNKCQYDYVYWPKINGRDSYFYNYLNHDKNYKCNHVYLRDVHFGNYFQLPDNFNAIFVYEMGRFIPSWGQVCKIDNKYYLVLYKYESTNYQICAVEMGDTYEKVVEAL